MLSGRELALGVVGAWRLVRGDRTALLCFDRSPAGFWRSFWVMLIVAPARVLLDALQLDQLKIVAIGLHIVLLQAGFYIIGWLLMPALLSQIALRNARIHQFMTYVIASNYAQIPMTGFWLMALVMAANVPSGAGEPLLYLALGLLLLYQYRIARVAFELRAPYAALLALAEFGVSYLLQYIDDSLLQVFVPAAS